MFTVTPRPADAVRRLRLDASGDFDVFAASEVRHLVRQHGDARMAGVDVDLSGVTWSNASGLRHLAQTRRELAAAGIPLVVSRPSPSVTTMCRRAHLGAALGQRAA